jgi:hypothetical protein
MEITLNSTDRLVQNHKSIFRKEEDGVFLFDSDTENMKYINEMGVNIYELCDGSLNVGDIAALVMENYKDIPREPIEKD